MSFNGWMHVIGAASGLVLGAVVLFAPKFGKFHRTAGLGYLISMVLVNISALTIYRETGSIGAFHILAMVSLITLGLGYNEVIRRRKTSGWLTRHGIFMSWSYVGLVAAGLSQFVSHNLPLNATVANFGTSLLVFVVGGILIFKLVPRVCGLVRQAART